MKAAEFRTKTIDELKETLLSLNEEVFNLRMQKSLGQLENGSRIGELKADIARVKTVMTEMSKQER